ncbi:hypothetical protein C8R47DRAFT_1208548 [Mycena vitilis]|nr:hypothetical protein C8R47DRAFT_1208548 [Mycena vitilis]
MDPDTPKNNGGGANFDRIQVYALQREPYWMAMMREARKQEGPAPTACSWCRCKAGDDEKMYRCKDCLAGLPACRRCILVAHMEDPLHFPAEWAGTHWKRVTLDSLGYVFQEGHGGLDCPNPAAETEKQVLYRMNGRHEIVVRKCNCGIGEE